MEPQQIAALVEAMAPMLAAAIAAGLPAPSAVDNPPTRAPAATSARGTPQHRPGLPGQQAASRAKAAGGGDRASPSSSSSPLPMPSPAAVGGRLWELRANAGPDQAPRGVGPEHAGGLASGARTGARGGRLRPPGPNPCGGSGDVGRGAVAAAAATTGAKKVQLKAATAAVMAVAPWTEVVNGGRRKHQPLLPNGSLRDMIKATDMNTGAMALAAAAAMGRQARGGSRRPAMVPVHQVQAQRRTALQPAAQALMDMLETWWSSPRCSRSD